MTLAYRGLDGATRSTTLRFSPRPAELSAKRAEFAFPLGPRETAEIGVEIV